MQSHKSECLTVYGFNPDAVRHFSFSTEEETATHLLLPDTKGTKEPNSYLVLRGVCSNPVLSEKTKPFLMMMSAITRGSEVCMVA